MAFWTNHVIPSGFGYKITLRLESFHPFRIERGKKFSKEENARVVGSGFGVVWKRALHPIDERV